MYGNGATVQDLPDEMLEAILLHLGLEDRKSALQVCKRWSALKPFESPSIQLIVHTERFNDEDYQEYHQVLVAGRRRFKHVVVYISKNFTKYDLLLEILSSFTGSVESLKIDFESRFDVIRSRPSVGLTFFAKIAALLPKLKHLEIHNGTFESDQNDLKFTTLNRLEELHLTNNLLTLIPNMQEITPNITRLHLMISSKESIRFLRRISSQLVELEVWFVPEDDVLAVCTMQFPLLEKVTFFCIDGDFNVVPSKEAIYQFFQQLRGLKKLALQRLHSIHFDNLCRFQSFTNVQFLRLGVDLDAYDFLDICKLKQLKHLRIEEAFVNVPNVLDFPTLQSLQMLSLEVVWFTDQTEFNRFRRYAFPSLAIVELLYLNEIDDDLELGLFEQYDSICRDVPCFKRLGLVEKHTDLQLDQILKFCASRAPRELRIKCQRVLHTDSTDELSPIPVETLIMEVFDISLESLYTLIKSMDKLKRLEVAFRPTGFAAFKPHYTLAPESIRCLRDAFSRCEIVERRMVQIEEPRW